MSNTELIGCVQHDCAKCKAVQDEVYLRNGDVLRLMKERDALQAEVERLKSLAVMEFNEDEIPSFTQGYHPHELTTVVTADRCSDLVKMITDLRAQLAAAQAQEPVGFVESAVRGAGGFHARFSSCVFIPAGTQLFAAPVPQQAQPELPVNWAGMLHYPQCWDTAAYPTLHDAIHEALAFSGCSVCKQAQPERAPLTKDERTLLFADAIGFGDESWQSVNRSDLDHIVEKVEAAHGIKQGGQ